MTSFCILNKNVSGSAISNKPARLGTVHQNLKCKAIKQCDFKMDLIVVIELRVVQFWSEIILVI